MWDWLSGVTHFIGGWLFPISHAVSDWSNADHGNAESAFVELSFGANTVFATFKTFRERIREFIENAVVECSASIDAIEVKNEDKSRVRRFADQMTKLGEIQNALQDRILEISVLCAKIAAVLCVLVLYLDLLKALGFWNILLISPIIGYWVSSWLQFALFKAAAQKKVVRFKGYVTEFEQPEKPPSPSALGEEVPKDNSGF